MPLAAPAPPSPPPCATRPSSRPPPSRWPSASNPPSSALNPLPESSLQMPPPPTHLPSRASIPSISLPLASQTCTATSLRTRCLQAKSPRGTTTRIQISKKTIQDEEPALAHSETFIPSSVTLLLRRRSRPPRIDLGAGVAVDDPSRTSTLNRPASLRTQNSSLSTTRPTARLLPRMSLQRNNLPSPPYLGLLFLRGLCWVEHGVFLGRMSGPFTVLFNYFPCKYWE